VEVYENRVELDNLQRDSKQTDCHWINLAEDLKHIRTYYHEW